MLSKSVKTFYASNGPIHLQRQGVGRDLYHQSKYVVHSDDIYMGPNAKVAGGLEN